MDGGEREVLSSPPSLSRRRLSVGLLEPGGTQSNRRRSPRSGGRSILPLRLGEILLAHNDGHNNGPLWENLRPTWPLRWPPPRVLGADAPRPSCRPVCCGLEGSSASARGTYVPKGYRMSLGRSTAELRCSLPPPAPAGSGGRRPGSCRIPQHPDPPFSLRRVRAEPLTRGQWSLHVPPHYTVVTRGQWARSTALERTDSTTLTHLGAWGRASSHSPPRPASACSFVETSGGLPSLRRTASAPSSVETRCETRAHSERGGDLSDGSSVGGGTSSFRSPPCAPQQPPSHTDGAQGCRGPPSSFPCSVKPRVAVS